MSRMCALCLVCIVKKKAGYGIRLSLVGAGMCIRDRSDTALGVPFDDIASMTAAFEAAYQARFGFLMPEKGLVAATISVESIGRNFDVETMTQAVSDEVPNPLDTVSSYMDGAAMQTPVFDRSAIGVGQKIMGPALIIEATGTNVIEPGWQAEMTARGGRLYTSDTADE